MTHAAPPVPAPFDALVIGGGVLGLATATALRFRGLSVGLIDPAASNASTVAAGMVAPALESALEPDTDVARARLLNDAAALWPAFAARADSDFSQGPARWRGGDAQSVFDRLAALGFRPRWDGGDVLAIEDGQVEPVQATTALRAGLGHSLTVGSALALVADGAGWRIATTAGERAARNLIVATGTAVALPGAPSALSALIEDISPIRGQIGWTDEFEVGEVIRGPGAYVAPSRGGTLIGATMEPGRRDLEPDPALGQGLLAAAERLIGRPLDPARVDWRVGVRGATQDGLPLAGQAQAGLFVALAPRRNGWLLAPLVAQIVADAVEGRAPGLHAAALRPDRFS